MAIIKGTKENFEAEVLKAEGIVVVDFETFKREIPSMLSDIKKDICTIYNPNKLSDEEYIRLLLKIYFGE